MKQTAFNSIRLVLLLLLGVSGLVSGQLIEAATETPAGPWELVVDPDNLKNMTELIPYTVDLTLIYNSNEPPDVYQTENAVFVVRITYTNYLTISLSDTLVNFTWADIVDGNNKTIIVTGKVIGYEDLTFELDVYPSAGEEAIESFPLLYGYHVTVNRESNLLGNIFTL